MEIHIIIIVVCVILSAYFSATETAFSTYNRIRVKNMAEKGNKKAALARRILAKAAAYGVNVQSQVIRSWAEE